ETNLAFNVAERPGGHAVTGLPAQFLHARIGRARRRRTGCPRTAGRRIGISVRHASIAPEYAIEEIIVGVCPIGVVVAIRPERVVEDVGIGVRPEHRSEPGDEAGAVMVSPCIIRGSPRPAIVRIDAAGLLCEACREAALTCRVRCHARHSVAAVLTRGARGWGLLRFVRRREVLAGAGTLLPCLVPLLALPPALPRRGSGRRALPP